MIDAKVKKTLGAFHLQAELHDSGFICLSGRNGSGKSTLLRIIAGLLRQEEGVIRVGPRDITTLPLEQREVVFVTPDSYIPHLTVERHLRWGIAVRKLRPSEQQISEVKSKLKITYDGRVDRLSLGMRERVSLATALLSEPKALLVDEAFSNLDDKDSFIPSYRDLCAKSNIDVVFTTQTNEDAKVADHHYHMEKGTAVRLF